VQPEAQRIDHAEAFIAALGADIRHGGSRAFYAPGPDFIQMPPFAAFGNPVAYYATLAHEATYWTGHKSRCDRDLSGRFKSELTPPRSWLPSWARRSFAPTSPLPANPAPTMPPMSQAG
jgi:antirestriction protein ArdC